MSSTAVYTTAIVRGASPKPIKTSYPTIEAWVAGTGAIETRIPVGTEGVISIFGWQLPDGTLVDAVAMTEEEAASRGIMEWAADELCRDKSRGNIRKVATKLRQFARRHRS